MENGSSSNGGADSLNGLKFGKKIYFQGAGSVLHRKTGAPSPAKKGRSGMVQRGQPPRCQVEGCGLDLSDAKVYYSRHKVCGMHSKSPKVIVAGIEQRFCQQCSRFHQLPEFDKGKRSCRRRLADHNERRRKPSPGSLFSHCYGSVYQPVLDKHRKPGSFVMDFSAYSSGRDPWPNSMSLTSSGNPPFTWQSNSRNTISELLQGTISRPSYSGLGVSSEECYSGVTDSSSALSLLSTHPWASSRSQSSNFGVNSFLGTSNTTTAQTTPIDVGRFTWPSLDFKGDLATNNNTLHEMIPDLGLGQISHPANNSLYPGELGLAQPSDEQFHGLDHSRGYDSSSIQHIHWSL